MAPQGDKKTIKMTSGKLRIYWQLWSTMAKYSLAEVMVNRATSVLFFLGKGIRFAMMLFFLLLIKQNIHGMAGYTTDQVVVFFLTYQFTDTLAQILYRGVYIFSWQVRSGELDFYLAKPINPLFRILTGKPDIIDVFFFIPSTLLSMYIIAQLNVSVTLTSALVFLAMVINGFLITTGFHILVVCLGVMTTEVDNAIMLYRDTVALSKFPVTIYGEAIRIALFFLVPVGIMNTLPAQFLLQLQPSMSVFLAGAIGLGFFALSLLTWRFSLRKYTSAGG
jgi:ABC-2 type transport system permease protein